MGSMHNDLPGQIRTYVALALVVCIGMVGANAATASFNDVPPEGQFAESITRVQEAGIATGFNDGSFRPRDALNRQQAASWVDRAVARVGYDWNNGGSGGTTLTTANPSATMAEIEMTSPAADGASGWVTIQGGVSAVGNAPGATCPCVVDVFVRDEDGNLVGRSVVSAVADELSRAVTISPIVAVVPVNGGETHTYRVIVELADATQQVKVGGAVYAMYSPMADGEPTQLPESGGQDPVETMIPG